MIIAGIVRKIKLISKKLLLFMGSRDTLLAVILLGVAVISFYLGSKSTSQKYSGPKIVFNKVDIPVNTPATEEIVSTDASVISKTNIFASRNGKKYYYIWCASAGRIKPHNRVYYDTKEQAIASGKSLASNCKEQ